MVSQNITLVSQKVPRCVTLIQEAGELVRFIGQRQFVQIYPLSRSLEYEQKSLIFAKCVAYLLVQALRKKMQVTSCESLQLFHSLQYSAQTFQENSRLRSYIAIVISAYLINLGYFN